jgi:hypothetical protein
MQMRHQEHQQAMATSADQRAWQQHIFDINQGDKANESVPAGTVFREEEPIVGQLRMVGNPMPYQGFPAEAPPAALAANGNGPEPTLPGTMMTPMIRGRLVVKDPSAKQLDTTADNERQLQALKQSGENQDENETGHSLVDVPVQEVDLPDVPHILREVSLTTAKGLTLRAPEQGDDVLTRDADAKRCHEHSEQRRGPCPPGEGPVHNAFDRDTKGRGSQYPEHRSRPEWQTGTIPPREGHVGRERVREAVREMEATGHPQDQRETDT